MINWSACSMCTCLNLLSVLWCLSHCCEEQDMLGISFSSIFNNDYLILKLKYKVLAELSNEFFYFPNIYPLRSELILQQPQCSRNWHPIFLYQSKDRSKQWQELHADKLTWFQFPLEIPSESLQESAGCSTYFTFKRSCKEQIPNSYNPIRDQKGPCRDKYIYFYTSKIFKR